MKRILILMVLFSLMLAATSCNTSTGSPSGFDSIVVYQDIPGVTDEEISAIEALKASRDSFTYGHLTTTEAFVMPDGTNEGFNIRFCELLSKLFGVEFVTVTEKWDDLLSKLDDGSIDFTGELTTTPERLHTYYMTHAIAEHSLRIFTHVDADEIRTESDVNGLKVGSLEGAITNEQLMKTYSELSFTSVIVESFDEAAQKISSGEIDIFVSDAATDPMFEKYEFIRSKEFFPMVYSPVALATSNPELKPFISVIDKYLEAGGIDKLFDLYKDGELQYAKYKLNKSLTVEERAYINDLMAQGEMVNIAYESENYPICFYNETDGEFQGIAVDVLRNISELTGISFKSVTDQHSKWSEIHEMLKTGDASMVPQLIYIDSRRDDFLFASEPYCTARYALISKEDYPELSVYQVFRSKVGNIKDSAYEAIFYEWFPGNYNTRGFHDAGEAFDALNKGDIDMLMASELELLGQVNYRELPGYKINILFNAISESMFGFNKDEEILCSIINKAQGYINTETIMKSWTGRVYDYSKQMANERTRYLAIFAVILLCAMIFTVRLLFKNKRLSKNLEKVVQSRTRELERQSTTLSTIYTSIPDLVFCKDIGGFYVSCNPSFEKFVGMSEAELIGKSDTEIFKIDGEMARLFIEADKKVLNKRDIEVVEEWITYPDGSRQLVETYKTPLIQDGDVVGVMGISRNITERKAAEYAIGRQLEQQELMAGLSQNFISAGEIDARITRALQMTGEFMDISRIMLLRYDEEKLHYEYEWDNPLRNVESKLGMVLPMTKTEKRIVTVFAERLKNHYKLDDNSGGVKTCLMLPVYVGEELWGVLVFDQSDSYKPWTSSDVSLGEMIAGVLSGVIRRRYMEIDLINAKELAEQSSSAKGDFLSRMSHEMRTPLNAVIGMTSIARSSQDIERKDYCLEKIDSASTHLLGVINDVLDMSKIEAGKFEVSYTAFNLEKMLIKITNVVNYRMEEKGQQFIVKIDNDIPYMIISDEQRIAQVVTNLLSNAAKFTPDNGTISLFVRKLAEDGGIYTLEFEVQDTGIGVTEEQAQRLFTSFEQADGSISRKYGGTGLGLAISKRIVEMLHGEIRVESEVGKGSRFIFYIRAEKGNEETKKHLNPDIKWENLRIMAVDDSEEVRAFFLSLLEPLKMRCEVAESGAEACELIEQSGPFDIIFIDWKMPGMDGIELTKIIKERYRENTIVIMISATEWSYIEDDAKQAGVDRFIPKPLFVSVIADCITECFGQDTLPEQGIEQDEERCFENKRILLAEDVEINREIIIALLEPTGVKIDSAEDGRIAFQMFQDNPNYDMIFMDIHMPNVDGYESTTMIRALDEPRAKEIPIIAMTANVFREDIEKCLEVGMNGHIGKPLEIEDVMKKLRQYLL